jgi:hypothetical protein
VLPWFLYYNGSHGIRSAPLTSTDIIRDVLLTSLLKGDFRLHCGSILQHCMKLERFIRSIKIWSSSELRSFARLVLGTVHCAIRVSVGYLGSLRIGRKKRKRSIY